MQTRAGVCKMSTSAFVIFRTIHGLNINLSEAADSLFCAGSIQSQLGDGVLV